VAGAFISPAEIVFSIDTFSAYQTKTYLTLQLWHPLDPPPIILFLDYKRKAVIYPCNA